MAKEFKKAPSRIISSDDQGYNKVVLEYKPSAFSRDMAGAAKDFLEKKKVRKNDFQISEIASKQAGILKIESQKIDQEIEKKTLLKLKEVQERAYKEAYELGLLEGRETAFSEKSAEISESLEKMSNLFLNLETTFQDVYSAKESVLIKLLYHMASKIAQFEIQNHQDKVIDLLADLIDEIQADERVVIRVSAEDYGFIQELLTKSEKDLEFLKRVKIEGDSQITSGGCFLETNSASIDATVEQRVKKLWSALEEKIPVATKENISAQLEPQDEESQDIKESQDGAVNEDDAHDEDGDKS